MSQCDLKFNRKMNVSHSDLLFYSPVILPYIMKSIRCLRGGWVRQRCHVSCVTRAFNLHWLTIGQCLLFLQQVRVEGGCFYFFCFSLSFISSFSPIPPIHLYYLFYLSSPFLREMMQNDPQGLTCR